MSISYRERSSSANETRASYHEFNPFIKLQPDTAREMAHLSSAPQPVAKTGLITMKPHKILTSPLHLFPFL